MSHETTLMKVYIVEVYDELLEGAYVEPTCYASKEDAIRRVESQTYTDEYGLEYWARWRELEVVERTCHLVQHGSLANYPQMVCWSCSECGFGWHHSVNDKQFSYCPNCGARVKEES